MSLNTSDSFIGEGLMWVCFGVLGAAALSCASLVILVLQAVKPQ